MRTWRLLAFAPLLWACKEGPARFRPLAVGQAAPAFAAPSLTGDTVSVASLRGQVVMLNVWATWCLPCQREMPFLDSLSQQYQPTGLRVVGVSIDIDDSDAKVRAFGEAHGIHFTLLRDPANAVTQVFQTRGVPETFLIDRDGKLAQHWIGGVDASAAEVRSAVENALGSSHVSSQTLDGRR